MDPEPGHNIGERSYRLRLAENIARRMKAHPAIDSPEKLAKRVYWTDGRRKGKRVAARTIRYVLDPSVDAPSPALDLIVAIAGALNCEPWELLIDRDATRRQILEAMFGEPERDGPPFDGATERRARRAAHR